jgi:hypothetical protein
MLLLYLDDLSFLVNLYFGIFIETVFKGLSGTETNFNTIGVDWVAVPEEVYSHESQVDKVKPHLIQGGSLNIKAKEVCPYQVLSQELALQIKWDDILAIGIFTCSIRIGIEFRREYVWAGQ